LRVILRALVNLDPYTFADDLAEDMADENDKRSAEEVLLALIEGTGDDKLTSFAARLALAGHRGVPRENELDFLAEAETAFLTPKPKKNPAPKKEAPARKESPAKKEAPTKKKEPTPIKPAKTVAKKKAAAVKEMPQPAENAVAA
jgi:ParB family chromosome partitioning protein